MSGFFNMTHEENAEIFPEAEQEVLEDGSIKLTVNVDSKRIDGHRHLVILAPGAERLKQTSLLRAIQKSRQWTDMLINGEAGNVSDLAEKLGHKPSYVTRILSLNNLAPDIVESILAGTEPDGLSIEKLTRQPIPEDWNEQRRLYQCSLSSFVCKPYRINTDKLVNFFLWTMNTVNVPGLQDLPASRNYRFAVRHNGSRPQNPAEIIKKHGSHFHVGKDLAFFFSREKLNFDRFSGTAFGRQHYSANTVDTTENQMYGPISRRPHLKTEFLRRSQC